MKKALLIIVVSALVAIVKIDSKAQATYRPALLKGSSLIGGNLSFSFGSIETKYSGAFSGKSELSYNSFSFSPKAGFFVANGFALGFGADITSSTYKDADDDSESTTSQFTVGPIIRFYTHAGLFFDADLSFGKATQKYSATGSSDEEKATITKWQLGAGYAIFLNDFVAIEPGVSYRSASSKSEDVSVETNSTIGEFVLSVGLNIYLHK